MTRPLHPHFANLLSFKEQPLIDLFCDLRNFVLELNPEANELLYHTHALTAVFSLSDKLGDAYCMIPIYTAHLNLGFNKGTLLKNSKHLLQGTGNLIRHIPIERRENYRNPQVERILREAIDFARKDMEKPSKVLGGVISKIKK